jgi:hypothetical protein
MNWYPDGVYVTLVPAANPYDNEFLPVLKRL